MKTKNLKLKDQVQLLETSTDQLTEYAIHLENEDCRKDVVIRQKEEEADKAMIEMAEMRQGFDSMSAAAKCHTGEIERYADFVEVLKEEIAEKDSQLHY